MSITRVSIVIPTYRRGPSLARAVAALESQSHPAHEILVIDQNAAGWLSAEVGEALVRAKVIWTPQANASAARNLGFVRSSGDVVLFIDDDLTPASDFLARAVSRLEAYPDVGCLCPVIVAQLEDVAAGSRATHSDRRRVHQQTSQLVAMPSVISAAMFFRRDAYERSGGFDELLFDYARAGEDQELCFRMTKRNLTIWLDTVLAIFHDENVPGGCELRTRPFWESRERSIRSNVLRARLHAEGRIELPALVGLFRSAFLNRKMVTQGPTWTLRNARLLVEAVADTRRLLRERGEPVLGVTVVDHLARHREIPRE